MWWVFGRVGSWEIMRGWFFFQYYDFVEKLKMFLGRSRGLGGDFYYMNLYMIFLERVNRSFLYVFFFFNLESLVFVYYINIRVYVYGDFNIGLNFQFYYKRQMY